MFIRTIILFVLAASTMSFSLFKSKSYDYADAARKIRAKVGKQLAKKHQMQCIGVVGGMMDSIYIIGLRFEINHVMELQEARARVVDCVEQLMKAFNEDEKIRPFLKNYPFTHKNINVAIIITHPDGTNVVAPSIGVVAHFENDYIYFYTLDPQSMDFQHEYIEPYQKAKELVLGSQTQS